LIVFQGPPRFGAALGGRLAGDLVLAASGCCWALYTVLGKPVLARAEPLDYTAATTALCFLGVAAWAAPTLSPSTWGSAGRGPWLAIVYLAVVGSFLGAVIWNVALRRVEPSRLANSIFLQPVVGVAIGVGFLGDPLTRWTAAGGALVLAGMWAATRSEAA
jgi:drug/metabolite transporter (DMT)-like permease